MIQLRHLVITVGTQCLAIFGHVIVIFAIYKAKLRDNRYFLIKWLCATDMLVSVCSATGAILFFTHGEDLAGDRTYMIIKKIISLFGYQCHLMSLTTTVIIALDRWFAITFSLEYQSMVTTSKLAYLLIGLSIVKIPILAILMFYTRPITTIINSSYGLLWYITIMRLLTFVVILVTAGIIFYKRRRQEKRHKEEKKSENILDSLKRSLKDVFVLNCVSAIFLLPMLVMNLLTLVNPGVDYGGKNVLTILLYSLSNPVIYICSQSKISSWLKANLICCRPFLNSVRVSGSINEQKNTVNAKNCSLQQYTASSSV